MTKDTIAVPVSHDLEFWRALGHSLEVNNYNVIYYGRELFSAFHKYGIKAISRFIYERKPYILSPETGISTSDNIPNPDTQWGKNVLHNYRSYYSLSDDQLNHLYNKYKKMLLSEDVDTVIVWNDYKHDALAAFAARQLSLSTIFIEAGFIPDTLQIDTDGCNANASFSGLSIKGLDKEYPKWGDLSRIKTSLPEEYHKFTKRDEMRAKYYFYKHLVDSYFYNIQRDKLEIFKSPARYLSNQFLNGRLNKSKDFSDKNQSISLPEEYVFAPLQVEDDVQVKYNSDLVRNMQDFVYYVHDSVSKIPGIELVIKEHPEQPGIISKYDLENSYPGIKFLTDCDITELIFKSTAVITVNSTVGMESIQAGKPVVTLGDAVYNTHNGVYHAESPAQITQEIRDALNHGSFDASEYVDKFSSDVLVSGDMRRRPAYFDAKTINKLVGYIDMNS